MKFSFLHAADLHLGSPLIGLAAKDEDIARQFAAASRQAFSDLVAYAIEQHIAFVVIAGDIYDGEWKDSSIGLFFNRELSRLHRAGIEVVILKGNHDAASVVTKTITLPESVYVFPTNKASTFRLDDYRVALHGRSFPNREVNENYVEAYPEPVAGWFNIGVLHTSCDGRPPHARYAPCSLDDMRRHGYDYWALGHVHAHEILCDEPKIVFAGNLQGRSIRECGPKGAVRVDVEDQAIKTVTHIPFDQARFGKLTLDLGSVEEEADLLRLVETNLAPFVNEAGKRLLALRVECIGETSLHRALKADAQRLSDEVQAAAHRVSENVWLEKLAIATREPASMTGMTAPSDLDLAGLFAACEKDPVLREDVEQLIKDVSRKLPRGCSDQGETLMAEIDALIEDARASTLGRVLR
ncbi:metallophosphoesterase family protein [Beijerinckia indica]|uniref:Metallophosphoesterase n=1 Tax=Beijerinckia indica subsp. indica (strain ATCC 9039 / DSM 1715 / NCIMB 8712) TaxID=395963 RepID=B2IBU7_BEII9|nr:DNA repair exonuclease [Beijerinckia indica]ACB93819.1 metallophosphoesterase [Beijerinckia indica subsp. indica ATCC 9039]